jgi:hypothetical protein
MFFLVGYMSLIITVARNFCGLDWMQSNPGGLKLEFDGYFKSLSAEQLKVRLLMFSAQSLVYLTNITAQGLERHGGASQICCCECAKIFRLPGLLIMVVQKTKSSNTKTASEASQCDNAANVMDGDGA